MCILLGCKCIYEVHVVIFLFVVIYFTLTHFFASLFLRLTCIRRVENQRYWRDCLRIMKTTYIRTILATLSFHLLNLPVLASVNHLTSSKILF